LLISFKYSINNYKVKKLEQKSQSAGNIISGTPETLRDGIVNIENIKLISKHVPKHIKPLNDEQLGYYLAGLIDGDGHFSNIPQLVIVFSSPDAFLAYLIKEKLGYGSVKKVKDKNAYILVVAKKEGILRVLNLINGKLRTKHRFDQVINNILSNNKYKELIPDFTMNNSNEFDNHWFAGFSDVSSPPFKIQLITRRSNQNQLSAQPEAALHQVSLGEVNKLGAEEGLEVNKTPNPKALPIETRIVVWGKNLNSSVGLGRFTKQERDMIRIPAYQQSVITGLILSDGWLTFATKTSKSARLGFKQSLSHSDYFWFVFSILSPYCSSIPNFVISNRKGTNTYAYQILTRSLPCFTELRSIYYPNGIKTVPADIFNLLIPVALAHSICGMELKVVTV
jgi:hypothetical protein